MRNGPPPPPRAGIAWRSPFTLIWLGQTVSLMGSGLTSFALGVWVFQRTGSATDYAMIYVFSSLPELVFYPLAGAIVDRRGGRPSMILADVGAGFRALALVLLLAFGRLENWHVYAAAALYALFRSLQFPAYASLVALMIPQHQLGRANGMVQLSQSAAFILSPLLGGALLRVVGIRALLLFDLLTFVFAIVTLAAARVPETHGGGMVTVSWWRSTTQAWSYLRHRPLLIRLLSFFAAVNLLVGAGFIMVTPLVLSFSTAARLGLVLSVGSSGTLLGSVLMSLWGGPRRRIWGVLACGPLLGVSLVLMGLRPSVPGITLGMFCLCFLVPIINGCDLAIWQSKVAHTIQGRVFAFRRMIAHSTAPIAYLAAGPLADRLFGPLLVPRGRLASTVGQVIGVGPGRGIGLLFVVMGSCLTLVALAYALSPRLQLLEDLVADAAMSESREVQPGLTQP